MSGHKTSYPLQRTELPTKETMLKWIAELESGNFTQTTGRLNLGNDFCCLGVACVVLMKQEDLSTRDDGQLLGRTPAVQIAAPYWLKHIDRDFQSRSELQLRLSELNDNEGYTFSQIAAELRKIYIESGVCQ